MSCRQTQASTRGTRITAVSVCPVVMTRISYLASDSLIKNEAENFNQIYVHPKSTLMFLCVVPVTVYYYHDVCFDS